MTKKTVEELSAEVADLKRDVAGLRVALDMLALAVKQRAAIEPSPRPYGDPYSPYQPRALPKTPGPPLRPTRFVSDD